MKFVLLFNILLIIGAALAMPESEEDSIEATTPVTTDPTVDEEKVEIKDEKDNADIDNSKNKDDDDDGHVNYFYSSSVSSLGGYLIERTQLTDKNGKVKNVIKVNMPKIKVDGKKIECTDLTCPEEASSCHVISEAIHDEPSKMNTKAECLDNNGKVLDNREFTEPNPYPESERPFSREATVQVNGSFTIRDSNDNLSSGGQLSGQDPKEVGEYQKRIQQMLAIQQENFRRQMELFNKHMQETFSSPNFPFGNYNPFLQPNFGYASSFPSFGFNWPFANVFGIRPVVDPFEVHDPFENRDPYHQPPYDPFRPNVNFDTIEIDRPSNTFHIETSNPTNHNNPHDPQSINPYATRKSTELDESNEADNEILNEPKRPIMVNNMYNNNNRFNEKYRYAHDY